MRVSRFTTAALLAALTSACAVGPDFKSPDAPSDTTYDNQMPPSTATANANHGAAQTILPGQTLPGEWWTLFQSPALNKLITEALLHNPDLDAAKASLRVAEEDLAAGDGQLYPTVSGDFSATRQKTSGSSYGGSFPGLTYSLYNASLNVSYGLDIWGGTRRAIEDLEAQRDYQKYEMDAARLTLTSNVVTAAIQEASLRAQIAATKSLIDEQEKQVGIYKQQLAAGAITKLALLSEQTVLLQTSATLPPLESQLAQTRHELSTLLGTTPSHEPDAVFELASIQLPEQLPVELPSQLVERRPDIMAAEANLHAASAAIGVAVANRLPQFTITADVGSIANKIGNLFSPGGGIWSVGGSLAETFFDAGTLEHKEGAARAQFDQAAALYRKTVLVALQQVADSLRAVEADVRTLAAQSDAERAAAESLKLARIQYDAGSISYVALVDAENAEVKARIALVQAEAARLADTAALFQALGGGWTDHDQAEAKDEAQ